jgi:hypothetical protein
MQNKIDAAVGAQAIDKVEAGIQLYEKNTFMLIVL